MSLPPHLPEQPAPASAGADLAREVSLRLERWYQERALALPPETQAGFVEMGVDAVLRDPARARDDVLDQLIAELDASLVRIRAEAEPASDTVPAPRRRGLLGRLFGRG
jgi:hypothetical protein